MAAKKYKPPKRPGTMLYIDAWRDCVEDYSPQEIGLLLIAGIHYYETGEYTDFEDRGMRQFFKQFAKSIDQDRIHYEEICFKNAHNKYKSDCEKRGEVPLSFEDWKEQCTENGDDRQRPLTIVTNNNTKTKINPNPNNQMSIVNGKKESQREKEGYGEGRREENVDAFPTGYSPLNENEFENARNKKLAMVEQYVAVSGTTT